MWSRGARGPTDPALVPCSLATSPGFIKKGNPEGLDIKVSMHLCENHYLATKSHLVCAPGYHHLQQTHHELQL